MDSHWQAKRSATSKWTLQAHRKRYRGRHAARYINTLVERIEATENALRGLYEALQSLIGRVETLEHKQASQPKVLKPAPAQYSVVPVETVVARSFAKRHGVSRDRMETLCKSGLIETTQVPYQNTIQHQLSTDQQRAVIAYWQEHHISFGLCTIESCPCHDTPSQ